MSVSIKRIKELLKDENISDQEAEEIRVGFESLVEIIFKKWRQEKREKSNQSKE